ncbi:hypothetical protein B7993_09850 [Fibrobacter sp. UWH3]|nr:hypothetical protein B7993_09850 [Fibrobacter sp. UWH3]
MGFMFRFYTSRKPAYLHFAFLLLFLAGWLLSYMMPALKGFTEEDKLFYGTVTHASIPSIFGGTDIPFFDKTNFQINGDDNVNFVLYASKDMMDDMAEWYSFAAMDAGDIPLQITAVRVKSNLFVVHSISSMDGELSFDELVMDYQVYYAFIGCGIVGAMALAALVLLIMWLVKKRA